ncbi:MAG: glucose-1-phosphate adenylyltransferase [Gammaproteobacteria bacterium]|jgi:glucose-1-phosphate adenylyltransferase|nr:glucose-1-phosphate adenylyltransferase [Gammaproteobacteria bacterium]MBP6052871.1 glucose-1-phosphate adenylyltransferase [Pseudomonadales bacterium]MBK6582376.1 glucose-1-phosphate adenylyltransferase [Gammaproteobacteria bacterium]MBK7171485.1 glucose-1-phosphate adenylyltransferase [Gammaproteobacteria bacterium]MBK7521352.1 glucose-1-phosphate adenylyltransferase [Gammaproteobacteria bacterium]
MSSVHSSTASSSKVLSVIMGGGAGTRLFPLTAERAKPAVPLAGKYRLVDIPISNCINSAMRRIYVLTQFNSVSLHRHISQSYQFDHFAGGFVEILAAGQTTGSTTWYEGTADAVRKNLVHLLNNDFEYVLILSGDQLYRMDFRELIDAHVAAGAELTIATLPVRREEAHGLGIMQMDHERRIRRFVEKPADTTLLDSLAIDAESRATLELPAHDGDRYLASMGIYVFNRATLVELLDNTHTDFGKHIIPHAIATHRVHSFVFQGYWEDIGTIGSFFAANLDATCELPRFDFYNMAAPIFTHPRFLPASKINGAQIDHAVISDGCIINPSRISHSLVGIRSIIGRGSQLHRVITFGSDYYESEESIRKAQRDGRPRIGIGENCRIENAIIDKNARIGNNVHISPHGKPSAVDDSRYYVRDGIVVIAKNAVIPDGTHI